MPSAPWLTRSISLIAVGAILGLAITVHTRYVDIQTVGTVLFCVGVFDLLLGLALEWWKRSTAAVPPRRVTRVEDRWDAPAYGHRAPVDDPDRTRVLRDDPRY